MKNSRTNRFVVAILGVSLSELSCAPEADISALRQEIVGGECPADWLGAQIPGAPEGMTLDDLMPMERSGTEVVAVFYPVPIAGLQTLLPPDVQPLEIAPGVGIAGLQFFTNAEPQYNEALISVMVLDPGLFEGYTTLFDLAIPMTSPEVAWIDYQAFGLPSVVANQVKCHKVQGSNSMRCMAAVGDQLIVKVDVPLDGMFPAVPDAMKFLYLSIKEGYLVRTPVLSGPDGQLFLGFANTASIQFGEHPLGQALEAAGVGATPSYQTAHGTGLSGAVYWPTCQAL